jgi:hypothetical protein
MMMPKAILNLAAAGLWPVHAGLAFHTKTTARRAVATVAPALFNPLEARQDNLNKYKSAGHAI